MRLKKLLNQPLTQKKKAKFRFDHNLLLLKVGLVSMVLALMVPRLQAGELDCMVNVQSPASQGVDQTVYMTMQKEIMEYMNNRRWTDDNFTMLERIKCSITIVITATPSNDRFEGTMQVMARRPVHNSTYETVTFNYIDRDFRINYTPQQTLQFSENAYVNNITSLLNFFAFIIIGIDYDTFGKESGVPYFERARNILNMAASQSPEPGWQVMTGTVNRNRYTLVENLLNNSYKVIHNIYYKYHREGLDKMSEDINGGRVRILEALNDLMRLYDQNMQIFLPRTFVDAKSDELVYIFKKATMQDKQKFVQIMKRIDTSNESKYSTVLQEDNDEEPR